MEIEKMLTFKSLFFVLLVTASLSQAPAELVGDLRFLAKIKSIQNGQLKIEVAGKEFLVPQSAVAGDNIVINTTREVSMTSSEYELLRLQAAALMYNRK
jgi:hypothetical protein